MPEPSPFAAPVCVIGPATRAAVLRLDALIENPAGQEGKAVYRVLQDGLDGWADDAGAKVVDAVARRVEEEAPVGPMELAGWLSAHKHDPDAATDCIDLIVPSDVTVVERLPRHGSQKIVYYGKWTATDRDIVIKRFVDAFEDAWERELESFPLHLRHDNIIETYVLRNDRGDRFLVERRIETLGDAWVAPGDVEAANLLYHISRALAMVHYHQRIHCDVKPDNIGRDGSGYLLLDFGVSRRALEAALGHAPGPGNYSGTGSLRTQPPEVLAGGSNTPSSDVWALAASVFHARYRRFPLFAFGEHNLIPPVDEPARRTEFAGKLLRRADADWDECVVRQFPPQRRSALDEVVLSALAKDPDRRPSARELVGVCESDLALLVRTDRSVGVMDPRAEIPQIARFLPGDAEVLRLVPQAERARIRQIVDEIGRGKNIDGEDRRRLQDIKDRIEVWQEE